MKKAISVLLSILMVFSFAAASLTIDAFAGECSHDYKLSLSLDKDNEKADVMPVCTKCGDKDEDNSFVVEDLSYNNETITAKISNTKSIYLEKAGVKKYIKDGCIVITVEQLKSALPKIYSLLSDEDKAKIGGIISMTADSSATSGNGFDVENASEYLSLISMLDSSAASNNKKTVKKPKATKIVKKKGLKKGAKITWKKIKGVKGYQIKCSTSKKFNKKKTVTKTVKGAKKKTAKIKKLKKKKKYYIKIRTYKIVNNKKVYSKWSKAVKVKTK